MSFRILAIRPLENTSTDLLKGLKVNCLYKFYNEYTFLNIEDKDINHPDFEELVPEKELAISEIKVLKYKYQNIAKIRFNEQVPTNFFPNDITVSAVVGMNGSGKSSLLELYYFAVLILSNYNKIIDLDINSIKSHIQCELYVEIVDSVENTENFKRKVKKIHIDSSNQKDRNHSIVLEEAVVTDTSGAPSKFGTMGSNVDLLMFNNVLNYSIYGLNSEIMPWVEDLFWKNDAYQTPITINPFRDMGNIDINNEYLLAQARMILYVYVLKQNVFLDNIYLHEFNVKLDFNKYQYVVKDYQKENLTIERVKVFVNQLPNNNLNQQFEYLVNRILLITKENKNKKSNIEIINELKESFEICKEDLITADFFDKDNQPKNISLLKHLCFLYIFKKLRKITQVYKTYAKYRFIFNNDEWKYIVTYCTTENESGLKSEYTKSLVSKNKQELIIEYNDAKKNNDLTNADLLKIFVTIYLDKLIQISSDNKLHFDSYGKEIIELFKLFILNNFEKQIPPHLLESFNINMFLSNSLSEIEGFDGIENFIKDIDRFFVQERDENFIKFAFEKYIKELNLDNSHITFKLKQAINYYKIGLFDKISFDKEKLNQKEKEVELKIPVEFFQSNNGIEDIPIAFFDFNMQVVKTIIRDEEKRNKLVEKGELKPYPFNQLSSGEQQSIHTILTVVYHTYNLLSVNAEGKRVYKKIALIFDELELYLHPEYQRTFVNNLLSVLAIFKGEKSKLFEKNLMFSILLSTHSPFILSDIPSQNVLKLKEGLPIKNDNINSFGSNIHDLLADEFFLENGFMGEYASDKINKLFKAISNLEDNELTKQEYHRLSKEINLIGEMVLREPLVKLLDNKMAKSPANKEFLIQKYQSILNELTKN